MDFKKYVNQSKELQASLLTFIESEESFTDIENNEFLKCYEKQKNNNSQINIRLIIHLIAQVSKNHHRNSGFIQKIEQILLYFENDMKQTFSNLELFDIFKRNRRILLLLIEKKIILIDQSIVNLILNKKDTKPKDDKDKSKEKVEKISLSYFLYPEIKPFLNESNEKDIKKGLLKIDPEIFTNFDEKRLIGENDAYICKLIREDLVDEFIPYVNKKSVNLSSLIPQSVFETNPLLVKSKPDLIEYAAFFGSKQIFQFLEKNSVALNPSLWVYLIHGQNPELIHILEEIVKIKSEKNKEAILKSYKESIKCHHNSFAEYIADNLADQNELKPDFVKSFDENGVAYGFRYYNFAYFPSDLNNEFVFFYACQYDYITLVEHFLKSKKYHAKDLLILN